MPYQLGGGGNAAVLNVIGSPSLATLTIEAGVELQFYSLGTNLGGLFLGTNSRLVAVGTTAAPVLFTGLGVNPPAADGNQTDGALKIFVQPGSEFLLNSTISNSISHGVFRAWTGGLVDFLPTNTFANVAFCRQVLPHPPPPANCPVNPDCPQ